MAHQAAAAAAYGSYHLMGAAAAASAPANAALYGTTPPCYPAISWLPYPQGSTPQPPGANSSSTAGRSAVSPHPNELPLLPHSPYPPPYNEPPYRQVSSSGQSEGGAGPYTGFNDGGGKAQFSTTGGKARKSQNFPKIIRLPPGCANQKPRFRGGGPGPPAPPLCTDLGWRFVFLAAQDEYI